MSKTTSILVLGLVVAVTPFLGIPISWRNVVFVASGLAITILALSFRNNSISFLNTESGHGRKTDMFVENGDVHTNHVTDGVVQKSHSTLENAEDKIGDTK